MVLLNSVVRSGKRLFALVRRRLACLFFRTEPTVSEFFPEFRKLKSLFSGEGDAPRCLYLGDSVLLRVAHEDIDRRCLGELFCDELRVKMSADWIAHSAYHMEIYYYFLRYVLSLEQTPSLIILPINMRSFSPQWQYSPQYQFTKEIEFLKKAFDGNEDYSEWSNKHLRDDETAYLEFDQRSVDYSLSEFDTVGQFRSLIESNPQSSAQKDIRIKQIFIFHYLHQLAENNERLKFLKLIMQETLQSNSKLLAYITPINIDAGIRYLGTDFADGVRQNVGVIENVFSDLNSEESIVLLNCVENFSSDSFFQNDNATEHLNELGRSKLVHELIETLKSVL